MAETSPARSIPAKSSEANQGTGGFPASSGQDGAHDVAVDVGQAEIPPAVIIGEFLVIKTHQMEDGGMKVVDVHLVLDRRPVHRCTFRGKPRYD